jgi:DNA-binding MltR family transcriptional regulator
VPKSRVALQPIHFDDFFNTMEIESDRGCVLIGCHVLDVALEHRLRFHFSRRRRVLKKAIDPLFETTRPLSSFWAKIHMAHSLSLLDDWAFEDLNTIRSIRNALAHSHETFSFDSKEIEPLVFRLRCTRIAYGYPRQAWTVMRARKRCQAQATEWSSSPNQLYFILGFHYLHGYLTKGIAYKKRAG